MRTIKSVAYCSALAVLAACSTNPVTGRRELTLVSESQEISMGQEGAKQVEASIGLVKDPALQSYVSNVGMRLAAITQRPNLPWRFSVIDDPTPNAFALPGGPVYITRGLMSLMDSEAELATVLGHEAGHINARHSVSQISKAQLAQLGLGISMILVPQTQSLANLLGTGMQLLFLKYSRDDERQADDLGFQYALREGYDVREMADVFASLDRVEQLEHQSALPSWLATHPAPAERITAIRQKIAALPALPASAVVNRAEYLGHVENLVYGNDPRQGFFRGGEFLHPDLRFRLTFPSGWKTQNMTQAVMASSPQQDAAIQLTIAQGSVDAAANSFFGQQGIQSSQVGRDNVNGLPAVSGYFRATTQDGQAVEGLATFVSYNGSTYQVLSYTTGGRLNAYDNTFRSVARSFGPLNDPSALNVRPNRIHVTRLTSAMSLTEFNRRNPSVISIQELAVINQVESPDATLPAGTSVKRVTAS